MSRNLLTILPFCAKIGLVMVSDTDDSTIKIKSKV